MVFMKVNTSPDFATKSKITTFVRSESGKYVYIILDVSKLYAITRFIPLICVICSGFYVMSAKPVRDLNVDFVKS